ncbi:MAG TPA: DUF420 domain-containing protein [Cytophagaceae bacterium]
MLTDSTVKQNNVFLWIIGILSIAVPVLVATLFYIPQTGNLGDIDVSFLPHLNAVLNSCTAIALISGFYFIKNSNRRYHITSMLSAFGLSTLFLVSYVIYHYQGTHTLYGDLDHNGLLELSEKGAAGSLRYVYYFILITHIVLAAIVVPFVLFAVYFGISKQYTRHKNTTKYTFPIWLYVAVTGVIVYFLIKPYYI